MTKFEAAVEGDRWLALSDGRRVCWRSYGRPDGVPVLALHGTPGSRLKYRTAGPIACDLGLRLISPDRWGYGSSGVPRVPSLCGYAADIEMLADALGIDRFAIVGISGGGPFAVATAARLGSRISAMALVAPVGPIHSLPAGALTPFHSLSFRSLPRVPGAARATFAMMRALMRVAPAVSSLIATARAGAADRAIMRNAVVRESLEDTFRVGLAESARGPALDMQLFSRPWNLAFHDIVTPVRIWVGSADRNVPLAAIDELARNIPTAHMVRLPDAGHFWIALHYQQVLSWVAESAHSG